MAEIGVVNCGKGHCQLVELSPGVRYLPHEHPIHWSL
jgi:hypothetical protein